MSQELTTSGNINPEVGADYVPTSLQINKQPNTRRALTHRTEPGQNVLIVPRDTFLVELTEVEMQDLQAVQARRNEVFANTNDLLRLDGDHREVRQAQTRTLSNGSDVTNISSWKGESGTLVGESSTLVRGLFTVHVDTQTKDTWGIQETGGSTNQRSSTSQTSLEENERLVRTLDLSRRLSPANIEELYEIAESELDAGEIFHPRAAVDLLRDRHAGIDAVLSSIQGGNRPDLEAAIYQYSRKTILIALDRLSNGLPAEILSASDDPGELQETYRQIALQELSHSLDELLAVTEAVGNPAHMQEVIESAFVLNGELGLRIFDKWIAGYNAASLNVQTGMLATYSRLFELGIQQYQWEELLEGQERPVGILYAEALNRILPASPIDVSRGRGPYDAIRSAYINMAVRMWRATTNPDIRKTIAEIYYSKKKQATIKKRDHLYPVPHMARLITDNKLELDHDLARYSANAFIDAIRDSETSSDKETILKLATYCVDRLDTHNDLTLAQIINILVAADDRRREMMSNSGYSIRNPECTVVVTGGEKKAPLHPHTYIDLHEVSATVRGMDATWEDNIPQALTVARNYRFLENDTQRIALFQQLDKKSLPEAVRQSMRESAARFSLDRLLTFTQPDAHIWFVENELPFRSQDFSYLTTCVSFLKREDGSDNALEVNRQHWLETADREREISKKYLQDLLAYLESLMSTKFPDREILVAVHKKLGLLIDEPVVIMMSRMCELVPQLLRSVSRGSHTYATSRSKAPFGDVFRGRFNPSEFWNHPTVKYAISVAEVDKAHWDEDYVPNEFRQTFPASLLTSQQLAGQDHLSDNSDQLGATLYYRALVRKSLSSVLYYEFGVKN